MKNVHEGPIGIGTRVQYSEVSLSVGNVISDGKVPLSIQLRQSLMVAKRTWILRRWKFRDKNREYVYRHNFRHCCFANYSDIIVVTEVETNHKFGDKPFLGFDHVTMVPMCRKLIDPIYLTESEKKWLNDYHSEVFEKTKKFFKDDELTMNWLVRETQAY